MIGSITGEEEAPKRPHMSINHRTLLKQPIRSVLAGAHVFVILSEAVLPREMFT